jgi:UDP-N-acetylmuramoyl-L-alanyl-D-glutamate--2,6-diaminopimelate ligase
VLISLRPLAAAGRLICIFGCGGDRDRGKRAMMGAIAARNADHVVLTSDNPRGEDPLEIITDILEGVLDEDRRPGQSPLVIADRHEAIATTVASAVAGDVVLIAGKGHEDYQESAGRRVPFSDAAVVAEALLVWTR